MRWTPGPRSKNLEDRRFEYKTLKDLLRARQEAEIDPGELEHVPYPPYDRGGPAGTHEGELEMPQRTMFETQTNRLHELAQSRGR